MNKALKEHYQEHEGKISDKWELYLAEYHRLFFNYQDRDICLLEIGIQNGGSLEIWANYFAHAKKLVGCDIDVNCERLTYHDPRIKVIVGDANLNTTEKIILSHATCYDLIIDDGSHRSSDIIKSFARYFPHLADGGLFIVEDLHCSYWQEFEGGLFDPLSSIAFFKRLIDILNYEQWGVSRLRKELLTSFSNQYEVSFDEELLSHIHSIEFIDSICVIRKSKPEENRLGRRVIVGEDEVVTSNVKSFNSTIAVALDQSTNISSIQEMPSEEVFLAQSHILNKNNIQIASLNESLSEQKQELTTYNTKLVNLEGQIHILSVELFRLLGDIRSMAESANAASSITKETLCLYHHADPISKNDSLLNIKNGFISKVERLNLRKKALAAYRLLLLQVRSIGLFGKVINSEPPKKEKKIESSSALPNSEQQVQADRPELAAWITQFEPTQDQLELQRMDAVRFSYMPVFSVIIPVYQVPQSVLSETINSLIEQTYSNWEACIVWSDLGDEVGWDWLQEQARFDKRLKIKKLAKNGGISFNSNAALELAVGEYVALLDHDDTLAPWAFYEIAKLLQSSPELDFIYSDKDSITANGEIRMNALFKPSWSPEMLHSVNYLTHLNIMRTRLVREIGGWNSETDGAQDWDIFFRITERTSHIARIPSILYHWRILPTSTATGMAAKPYAAMSQLRTQQNYFKRNGLPAAVLPSIEGLFHIKWPRQVTSVDIILYQTGSLEKLIHILDILNANNTNIIRNIYVLYKTSSKALKTFKRIWGDRCILIRSRATNWNLALRTAALIENDQTVLLLDGSAVGISESLVEELSSWVNQHPDIAWASAIALHPDGTVYEAGRVIAKNYQSAPMFHGNPLFSFGWFGGPLWYRNARAASPYAIAMNVSDIKGALAALNQEKKKKYHFSEFCLALTANGRRGLINPFAKIYFNQSPESDWSNEGSLYHEDPYFHPAFDQVNPLRLRS